MYRITQSTRQSIQGTRHILDYESYPNYDSSVQYVATAIIMQKTGAGLQSASSCYWDNQTDGSCTVRWENKTMYCIVSVFGLAI